MSTATRSDKNAAQIFIQLCSHKTVYFPGADGWSVDTSIFGGWMDDLVVRDLEVDTYNNGDTVYTELQPYYLGVEGLAFGWEGLFRVYGI